jgi:hypothetical protein
MSTHNTKMLSIIEKLQKVSHFLSESYDETENTLWCRAHVLESVTGVKDVTG